MDAFKKWAGRPARPDYQWHQIVEQGNPVSKFARAAIHNPRNLIQIPTAIHQQCITKRFAIKNVMRVAGRSFNGTETVRTQIRRLSWDEQHQFGIDLLQFCGVDVIQHLNSV